MFSYMVNNRGIITMKPSERIYKIVSSYPEWFDHHLTADRKLELKIDAIIQYLDEISEDQTSP
jgi:oligoribonuclease NrnB/cAMP/cGMP phosphodiesterase (DHH superfamily)